MSASLFRLLWLALALSIALVVDANACSCRSDERTDLELQAAVCWSDKIFVAEALASNDVPGNLVEHILVIESVIKGEVRGLARSVPGQSSMCHSQFKKGERYVVFADERDDGARFASNKCGPTRKDPSDEFLKRVKAHVANAERICKQDFEKLIQAYRGEEYNRLIEETKRILSRDEDET